MNTTTATPATPEAVLRAILTRALAHLANRHLHPRKSHLVHRGELQEALEQLGLYRNFLALMPDAPGERLERLHACLDSLCGICIGGGCSQFKLGKLATGYIIRVCY